LKIQCGKKVDHVTWLRVQTQVHSVIEDTVWQESRPCFLTVCSNKGRQCDWRYSVAKMYRTPNFCTSFSEKEPYAWWPFCGKRPARMYPLHFRHPVVYLFQIYTPFTFVCVYVGNKCVQVHTLSLHTHTHAHTHTHTRTHTLNVIDCLYEPHIFSRQKMTERGWQTVFKGVLHHFWGWLIEIGARYHPCSSLLCVYWHVWHDSMSSLYEMCDMCDTCDMCDICDMTHVWDTTHCHRSILE